MNAVFTRRRGLKSSYRRDLPTQNGANQHPAYVAFVVRRIEVLCQRVAAVRVDAPFGPFRNRYDFGFTHRVDVEAVQRSSRLWYKSGKASIALDGCPWDQKS